MRRIPEENKISEGDLNSYYALSKFALNAVLALVANFLGWEMLLPASWFILLLPFGGICVCFFVFRYLLGLSKDSPVKMLLLHGTFSSWAFFLVLWILLQTISY